MAGTQLLIISQHRILRECLSSYLDNGNRRCAFTGCPREALEWLSQRPAEVVLVDSLGHSEESVLRLIGEVRRVSPAARLLLIGDAEAERHLTRYIEAGAAAFVSHERSPEELLKTIERVMQFEAECTPEQAALVFKRLQQLSRDAESPQELNSSDLTQREIEILKLVDLGWSNKEIAAELHVSIHTVKTHVHRILEKIGASNRRQAAYFASSNGWFLSPPSGR